MFDFLSSITVEETVEAKVKVSGGLRKDRHPSGLAIRLFRDGSVFPSAELVTKFSLEFPQAILKDKSLIEPKEGEVVDPEAKPKYKFNFEVLNDTSNGFDVIDTSKYPTFRTPQRLLIISPVNRQLPKVDLFSSTTYNEDGTPKSSVLDQGAKTFGLDTLIPLVKEVYNLTLGKEEGELDFIDLQLVANPTTGLPWDLGSKDVTYIPKAVSRGKDKGEITTIRREKSVFYALLPMVISIPAANSATSEEVISDIAPSPNAKKEEQIADSSPANVVNPSDSPNPFG